VPSVEAENVQVEVADPPDVKEALDGVHDTVSPADGEADAARPTLPEKPPRLVKVIVEEPLEPRGKPTVDGLVETV